MEQDKKLCMPPPLSGISLRKEKKSAGKGKNQVPKSPPVYQEMDFFNLIALLYGRTTIM